MSCGKFLGTMAALVALSPLSFAQSNSQDKTLDEIKQALAELRKENAELRQRLTGLESKPVATTTDRNLEREIAELSARFAEAADVGGKDHKGTPLTLTGELRERGEWRDQTDGTDDFRVLSRLTLNLDWMINDHLKVFAQLRDSRRFGDAAASENTDSNAVDSTPQGGSPEFTQVYAWFGDFMGTGANMKIGRQEMVYGDERIIGNNDWNNVGRSFEGFRADGHFGDVGYSMFLMMPVNTPFDSLYKDQRLYGLYLHDTLFGEQMQMDAYAMLLTDDLNDNHLQTYGGRLWGKFDMLDYGFEAAAQQNQNEDAVNVDFHEAYMFHGDIGLQVDDIECKPHLSFIYDMGSDLFNDQYADNHARFGESDMFVTVRNLVHTAVALNLDVYDGWTFGTSFHWNRAFSMPGADGLGNELDFTLKGKCGNNVWINIAAGRNFGDDGLATRGAGPTYITPAAGDKSISTTFGFIEFTIPF